MTTDIPTKLLAVMVTAQNYYYKPPTVQSHLKNILVEKNKTCKKPTDAKPVYKTASHKLVHKKNKCGSIIFGTKFHILHHQSCFIWIQAAISTMALLSRTH
jgi:hypothetical protein